MFLDVSIVVKLCLVVAVFVSSPSHQTDSNELLTEDVANTTASPDEHSGLKFTNPTELAQKEALDFAFESTGNEKGLGFEDKLVIGITGWFILRQDVDISKFNQAYTHHVEKKCNQLRSRAAKRRKAAELSLQDQSELEQKLVACKVLLEKSVKSKVKAAVINCNCRDKLQYRQSPLLAILAAVGLLACAVGVNMKGGSDSH